MLIAIACRNLIVNRRKSLAALLSIVVAFMSLSLFEGYLHDMRRVYDAIFSKRQMLAHVIIERRDSKNPGKAGLTAEALSPEEQAWIEQQFDAAKVRTHNRFLNINGLVASGDSRAIFIGQAYDPVPGALIRSPDYLWNTFAGSPLEREVNPYPIQLGRELAEVLGCMPTDETVQAQIVCKNPEVQLQVSTESGQANAMDFKVTGLLSTGFTELDARTAILPLALAQALFATKKISYMTVLLYDQAEITNWVKSFNAAALKDGIAVISQPWQTHSFGDLYRQSIGFLMVFRNLIITIILVVVSITTVNTFVKIVNERIREIATMRSIGYEPLHIIIMFCTEASLLGLIGSLIGLGFSYLAALAINAIHFVYKAGFMSEGFVFRFDLSAFDFLWITILIAFLTVISTFLPTWMATRVPISTILAEK